MQSSSTERIAGRATRLALALALCAATGLAARAARADDVPALVTAVIGDARAGEGRNLAEHSGISERERVVMGDDGKCSMLVDQNLVIQLCERTTVVLRRDPETGQRSIHVDAGTLRVIAEPRIGEERIEIHTPAAIATLLGTIAHFTVDPETGESTVSSMQSAVRVRGADANSPGETVVLANEQVTVRRGEPVPPTPRRIDPEQMAELTECVAELHAAALQGERDEILNQTIERLNEADLARVRRMGPRGGRPPASIPDDNGPPEDPSDPDALCTPADCGNTYGGRQQQLQLPCCFQVQQQP